MKGAILLLAAFFLATTPSVAQHTPATSFPVDRGFRAVSHTGKAFRAAVPTLTVQWDPQSQRFRGEGRSGCNNG
jgi:hypothetical protein